MDLKASSDVESLRNSPHVSEMVKLDQGEGHARRDHSGSAAADDHQDVLDGRALVEALTNHGRRIFLAHSDSLPEGVTFITWSSVPMDMSKTFGAAFLDGLAASTCVFSGPIIYSDPIISSPAQSFSVVGSYMTEMIPMVIDDGRTERTEEEEAA